MFATINNFIQILQSHSKYILFFILILNIIILIHELGHYIACRINNVDVEQFSLGFGPVIYSYIDSRHTVWNLRVFPLLGYIMPASEINIQQISNTATANKSKKHKSSHVVVRTIESATYIQKASIVLAGPLANILLTIVLFYCLFLIRTPYEMVPSIIQNTYSTHSKQITKKHNITSTNSKKYIIELGNKQHAQYLIIANNEIKQSAISSASNKSSVNKIKLACQTVCIIMKQFVSKVLINRTANITGPIGIYKQILSQKNATFIMALVHMAFISISVGLFNLLPLPGLDGYQLILYTCEAIFRRKLRFKTLYYIENAFVLSLTIYILAKDFGSLIIIRDLSMGISPSMLLRKILISAVLLILFYTNSLWEKQKK